MMPDYLAVALAGASVVYSLHALVDLSFMLKDYRDSKK